MVSTAMIGTKIFCFPRQIEMAFAMALTALLYTLKFIYLFIFIIFIFYVTLLSSFQLVGDSEVSVST